MTSPERVVVVGASGFGRECLDVLEAMAAAGSPVEVAGVVDDGPSELNAERLAARGVPYLGTVDEWLTSRGSDERYVLGIGSPEVRRRLVDRLEDAGARPFTAVHPSATFGASVVVGEGVVVCAGATISTNVRLGRHVHLNPHATVGHDAVLDDFVSVNPAAVISGEVTVGGRGTRRCRRDSPPRLIGGAEDGRCCGLSGDKGCPKVRGRQGSTGPVDDPVAGLAPFP